MTTVTWQSKLDATLGKKPTAQYHSGGIHWEDYRLGDVDWRYCWTHFKLEGNPEFIEVYNLTALS